MVVDRAWCVLVPHHPLGAGQVRSRMSAELARSVHPELLADAVAVIAELVGNAIRHAEPLPGDVIRVSWGLARDGGGRVIEIRVTDGGAPTRPSIRRPDPQALDGRGLAIVAALADSWGFDQDALGQTVWAVVVERGSGSRSGIRLDTGWVAPGERAADAVS
jgi:anti-sigma regulatory factor (Ser/Thr protein kinase)